MCRNYRKEIVAKIVRFTFNCRQSLSKCERVLIRMLRRQYLSHNTYTHYTVLRAPVCEQKNIAHTKLQSSESTNLVKHHSGAPSILAN